MYIAKTARNELVNAWRREPKLLETWEAAALAQVTERTIRRWLAEGSMAGLHKGRKGALVSKTSLINFMCGEGPKDAGDPEEQE